mmetsp:Transcript_5506/g.16656  ORF Transcript_5506/g.16656 Transcript_5506/m.16656 type:complete len:204 (-) Transcript_5506:251-862(-)
MMLTTASRERKGSPEAGARTRGGPKRRRLASSGPASAAASATVMRSVASRVRRPRTSLTSQPCLVRQPFDVASRSRRKVAKSAKTDRVLSPTAARSSKMPRVQFGSASKGDSLAPETIMTTSTPTAHASIESSARRLLWMIMAFTPVVSGALNGHHSSGSAKGRFVATSFGPAPAPTRVNAPRDETRTHLELSARCGRPRAWR